MRGLRAWVLVLVAGVPLILFALALVPVRIVCRILHDLCEGIFEVTDAAFEALKSLCNAIDRLL